MCGIIGMVGRVAEGRWGETYRTLTALLVESERRGTDATSFLAMTEPYKSSGREGILSAKSPSRASNFVAQSSAWRWLAHRRSVAVIGHTRLATHGSSDNPLNLHPFSSEGLSLFHNGVIHNHENLAARNGFKMKGECDSEVLLHIVARYSDMATGLRACLKQAEGSMAIAAYRNETVWLVRNSGSPLWLAKFRGQRAWWFASQPDILLSALRTTFGDKAIVGQIEAIFPLPENVPHRLHLDGRLIACP